MAGRETKLIAIISDIHANIHALEAVLSDMPQVSDIWVLGDTVGGGPFPCEVLERLLNLATPVTAILGNWEGYLFDKRSADPKWHSEKQNASAAHTISTLKDHHWSYLESLKGTRSMDCVPGGALLFHGRPDNVFANIESYESALEVAAMHQERWLFGGHIHSLRLFHIGQQRVAAVGSVGMAADEIWIGGTAAYALLDADKIVFRHVAYDLDSAISAFKASEYGQYIAPCVARAYLATLISGQNYMGKFMTFVWEYAKKQGCNDETIPDALWQEAGKTWKVEDWLEARIR